MTYIYFFEISRNPFWPYRAKEQKANRRTDVTHIGDIELEVGSSNVENKGWEDEGPISTVCLHE